MSEYLGSRLLLIGLVFGGLGLVLLLLAGINLWLAVIRSSAHDLVFVVALGPLSLALLSLGASARRNGGKYLRGDRQVGNDILRFMIRKLERRKARRP